MNIFIPFIAGAVVVICGLAFHEYRLWQRTKKEYNEVQRRLRLCLLASELCSRWPGLYKCSDETWDEYYDRVEELLQDYLERSEGRQHVDS